MQNVKANSASEILRDSDKPYILYFSAPWCGPCRSFKPVVSQVSTDRSDEVTVLFVDVDESPELAGDLGVKSIPTSIGFVNKQEVSRFSGARSSKFVNDYIDTLISGS